MTERQKEFFEIGKAYATPNRGSDQVLCTYHNGICDLLSWNEIDDFDDFIYTYTMNQGDDIGYLYPTEKDIDNPRALLCFLIAQMSDEEYNEIVENARKNNGTSD